MGEGKDYNSTDVIDKKFDSCISRHDELVALHDALTRQAREVCVGKNKDYGNVKNDTLSNFYQTADMLGISPQQACLTHMYKHFAALCRHARDGKLDSETLRGRVVDIINYSVIYFAIEERGKASKQSAESDKG